jgi:hypothetical protein
MPPKGKAKHAGGRPREIAKPRRLNLYVAGDFADDLEALAAHLSRALGKRVSIGAAITQAVRESPQFRAMRQKAKR